MIHGYQEKRELHGIYMVKPTGEISDVNSQYIEVELLRDVVMYARPCYPFGWVSAPTKEFLQQNLDTIFVWVMFEGGRPDAPVWLGFTFVDNKEMYHQNFPAQKTLFTDKFTQVFDDKTGEYKLTHTLSGNEFGLSAQNVYLKGTNVNIGDENCTEAAVLGTQLGTWLQNLCTAIQVITVTTSMGPSSPPINLAQFATLQAQIINLTSKFVKLK